MFNFYYYGDSVPSSFWLDFVKITLPIIIGFLITLFMFYRNNERDRILRHDRLRFDSANLLDKTIRLSGIMESNHLRYLFYIYSVRLYNSVKKELQNEDIIKRFMEQSEIYLEKSNDSSSDLFMMKSEVMKHLAELSSFNYFNKDDVKLLRKCSILINDSKGLNWDIVAEDYKKAESTDRIKTIYEASEGIISERILKDGLGNYCKLVQKIISPEFYEQITKEELQWLDKKWQERNKDNSTPSN